MNAFIGRRTCSPPTFVCNQRSYGHHQQTILRHDDMKMQCSVNQCTVLQDKTTRNVNQKPEIRFSALKLKTGSISLSTGFPKFFSIFIKEINKNCQMSDKINVHICLMLSVYNRFHQIVKYGHHRLQDFTGFET